MFKSFSIVFQILILSSGSYAESTLGMQGSLRNIFKVLHQSFALSQTLIHRGAILEPIGLSKKSHDQNLREHQKKIKDLKDKIAEVRESPLSRECPSIDEMQDELFALISKPYREESQPTEAEAIVSDAVGTADFSANSGDAWYGGLVPGIWSAGNENNSKSDNKEQSDESSVLPRPTILSCLDSQDEGSSNPSTPGTCAKISWNQMSPNWLSFVGANGEADENRAYLVNPLIFGWIEGKKPNCIIDIGTGNGYLARESQKLCSDAKVVGIDSAPSLLESARALSQTPSSQKIDYREDSASRLDSQENASVDFAVANFVYQDCARLDLCIKQLARVLKLGGMAAIVITHPCFPLANKHKENDCTVFQWETPYIEEQQQKVCLSGMNGAEITVFHRPVSKYVEEFLEHGFRILEVVEPHLTDELAEKIPENKREDVRKKLSTQTPTTLAFLLEKVAYKRAVNFSGVSSEPNPPNPMPQCPPSLVIFHPLPPVTNFGVSLEPSKVLQVSVPHPCFPRGQCSGNNISWKTPYPESLTLTFSGHCKKFINDGFMIIGLKEVESSEAFPAHLEFIVCKAITFNTDVPSSGPGSFDSQSSVRQPPSEQSSVDDPELRSIILP